MNESRHRCDYRKVPLLEISLIGSEIVAAERLCKAIGLLLKGQRKAKRARKCRICGRYAIECPYCHQHIESSDYPLKMTCPHCEKEFQVRWD